MLTFAGQRLVYAAGVYKKGDICISVCPCICHVSVCVYVCTIILDKRDYTHFCVHVRPIKKPKMVLLARQTFGVTDSEHGMQIQLDFKSNMSGIPPGYTSSH